MAQSEDPSTPEVVDNDAHDRLEVVQGDHRAELTYRLEGDRLVLVHTGVPEELGGGGIGGELVQAAVTKAAREGLAIDAQCSFAREWIDRHPEKVSQITSSA